MIESKFHFSPLKIQDTFGIQLQKKIDSRGLLTRIWDLDLFRDKFSVNQISLVHNPTKHTLRGLHFQKVPFEENKLIYCIYGRVFDVLVDLRVKSKTYLQYLNLEIGPYSKYQGIQAPSGCAHGYMTLEENSTLLYLMDEKYDPQAASGIAWNDPSIGIKWPFPPSIISDKDTTWPKLNLK